MQNDRGSALLAAALAGLAACSGDGPPAGELPPPRPADARTWDFEETEPGALPAGFAVAHGDWAVEDAADAPSGARVFLQRAENPRREFNVVLVESSEAADVDATVRLRAVRGRVDQGGGIVWRARDGRNYYVARWNPLESNVRAYYVVDGDRSQIAGAEVHLDPAAWHEMRVVTRGERIRVFLDGEPMLDLTDETFADPGLVGLWTKADAATRFDDLALDM